MNPRSPEPERTGRPADQGAAVSAGRGRLRAVDQGAARQSGRLARAFSCLCARPTEPEGACDRGALSGAGERLHWRRIPSTCAPWPASIRRRAATQMRSACWRRRWRCRSRQRHSLKTDTKLQYAGILMEAKRYDQAAALYTQILNGDPSNLSAWMGLVSAHHEHGAGYAGHRTMCRRCRRRLTSPRSAIPDFFRCWAPSTSRPISLKWRRDCWSAPQRLQIAAGGQPSVDLRVAAGRHLPAAQQYRPGLCHLSPGAQAESRARRCVEGLIATLLATNRNAEALQEIALIPAPCASSLRTTSSSCRPRPASTPPPATLPAPLEYMNSRAGALRAAQDSSRRQTSIFRTRGCSTTRATTAHSIRP